MPSTFRLLRTIAVIVLLAWLGIWALATFVEPTPREMTVTVPLDDQ